MNIEYSFSLITQSSATELAGRLSTMWRYRLSSSSADGTHARARVGSRFLLRMIGAGVYNKYTAPVDVEIQKNTGGADIRLTGAPGTNIFAQDRVNQFYQRTFREIESLLSASNTT